MKKSEELFLEMEQLWSLFSDEHHKDTKVSNSRARKAIGDLKKLVTEYRKVSIEEEKQ